MDFGGLSDPLSAQTSSLLCVFFIFFFKFQADTSWEYAAVQEDAGTTLQEPGGLQRKPACTLSCCKRKTSVQPRPCADKELQQEPTESFIHYYCYLSTCGDQIWLWRVKKVVFFIKVKELYVSGLVFIFKGQENADIRLLMWFLSLFCHTKC